MTQAGLGASFAPRYALAKLPALYATEAIPAESKRLLAKWFCPYSSMGPWLAAEYDPETRTCFGYVGGPFPEWGYFNLDELQSVRLMGGRLPAVERDCYFNPGTLAQLRERGEVA